MKVFKHNDEIDYTKFGPMPVQQALKGIIRNMYENELPETIIDIDSFSDTGEYREFVNTLGVSVLFDDPALFVLHKDNAYYYLLAKYEISMPNKVHGSYGMITKHSIKSKAFSVDYVKEIFQVIRDYIYYAGIRVKS